MHDASISAIEEAHRPLPSAGMKLQERPRVSCPSLTNPGSRVREVRRPEEDLLASPRDVT